MLDITTLKKHKSIPEGINFQLPEFSIITGKNGSGKTHLLEVLSNAQSSTILHENEQIKPRQFIQFGNLHTTSPSHHDPSQNDKTEALLQEAAEQIKKIVQSQTINHTGASTKQIMAESISSFRDRPEITNTLLSIAKEGPAIEDIDSAYIHRAHDKSNFSNDDDFFSANLSRAISIYNYRLRENDFQNYKYEKQISTTPGISDTEFKKNYGPEPWLLINDILRQIGMNYQIIAPDNINHRLPYTLNLIDTQTSIKISTNDLSTGEKAIMALALTIYRSDGDGRKPKILLLDEPDSPLHPEFSRLLVEVLQNNVVKQLGIKVVMSTHSPSTLAVCPKDAIYEMDRSTGCPLKISFNKGMGLLTSGIPHLRVSTEARRQIFVEHKYDVQYYEQIFSFLHRLSPFEYEPVFLQPHSGSSNCSDVVKIVSDLSSAGNDLVRGLIDWDKTNETKPPIFVLGSGARYAIENYILDPLFIGLTLVKLCGMEFSDFGVCGKFGFLSTPSLTQEDAQMITDYIFSKIGISTDNPVESLLLNDWTIKHPREFMEMQGHKWEKMIINGFPELNKVIRGSTTENKLKKPVLEIIEEVPEFLPAEVRKTLDSLS